MMRELNQKACETIAAADRSVGERTGIIRQISDRMIETDEPHIFHAVTVATNAARLYDHPEQTSLGGHCGAGLTRELAIASAIGETFERYCSAIYDDRNLITGTYKDLDRLGRRAVAPSSFALYSDSQYGRPWFIHKPFSEDREISWTEGYSLCHEEPMLVPACLVYLPFRYERPDDLIGFGVSTGLCCQRSMAEAILGGLYEVIERDAIMCMWMNYLPAPKVKWDSASPLASIFSERFEPCCIKCHLADITTDLPIPVLFGMLIDERNDGLAVAVGASANLNPQAAALKALIEAAQVRRWLKLMKQQDVGRCYAKDFSDVHTFEDHVRLFGSLSSIAYVDFLVGSSATIDILSARTPGTTNVQEDLRKCIRALDGKGYDVIAVDLTQPDIAELGFHVVKVVIPGMVDINADHNYPLLGGERLRTVPNLLGFTDRDTQKKDFNPIPHPFP